MKYELNSVKVAILFFKRSQKKCPATEGFASRSHGFGRLKALFPNSPYKTFELIHFARQAATLKHFLTKKN